LVRNPWLAAVLLADAAESAGIKATNGSFELPDEEIEQEIRSAEEARAFIRKKMSWIVSTDL
jgi:hypothetical protein